MQNTLEVKILGMSKRMLFFQASSILCKRRPSNLLVGMAGDVEYRVMP